MKNKYITYVWIALVVAFVIPQIVLGAWWNPLSWNWNIFSWFTPQIVQNQGNQNNSQTQSSSNSSVTCEGPTPKIISLSSTSATVGDDGVDLNISGTGFTNKSVINFDSFSLKGNPGTSEPVTMIWTVVPASYFKSTKTYSVVVTNPCGQKSNAKIFTVNATNIYPTPTISDIYPSFVPSNSPDIYLHIEGSNFVRSSIVTFNGMTFPIVNLMGEHERVGKPINDTDPFLPSQIGIKIPSQYLVTPGYYNVTVTNSSPGGGTSNTKKLWVISKGLGPVIAQIDKDSNAEILIIDGYNFDKSSVVKLNGQVAAETEFIPGNTTAYASTPSDADEIMVLNVKTGTYNVTISNPDGKVSNAVSFTLTK